MASDNRGIFPLLKAAFKDFGEDECGLRSAALAYFTVFALPPLLVLLVMIAGMIWSPQEVQRALEGQFAGLMGESGGRQIHEMMARGNKASEGGLGAIASILGLVLGATGFFLSLQNALNRVWEVKPDPEQGGVRQFVMKRMLSFGMLLGLGFLLAVSLALTAAVSALGGALGGGLPKPVMYVMELGVSFAVLSMLFAALFKYLPDAKAAWRDVLVGGAVTGFLFVIGKFAIGMYLGRSNPGDAFGAASALAVVLVWAYYAGMILLFGAEFTQQWARRRGGGIVPKDGAVHVIEREEHLRPGQHSGSRVGGTAAAAAVRGDGAEPRPAMSPGRGGLGDYILGLPVLYMIFRRQRR